MSIRRNDPCPCGSGKKYKKCCGAPAASSRSSGSKATLTHAQQLLRAGKLPQAEEVCKALLRNSPSNPKILQFAGVVAFEIGDLPQAVERFGRGAAVDPKNPELVYNYGTVLMLTGRHEDAAGALARASELDPANPEPLENLGVCFVNLGRHLKSIDAFRKALALEPGRQQAQVNLANSLVFTGKLEEARELLDEALGAANNDVNALVAMATLESKSGNADNAVAFTERALQREPNNLTIRKNLAVATAEAKDYVRAIKLYRDYLDKAPHDLSAWMGMAVVKTYSGDLEGAVADLRGILDTSSDQVAVLNLLADCYMFHDRVEEAWTTNSEAIEVAPNDPRSRSKRVFFANYLHSMSQEEIFSAHLAYGALFDRTLPRPEDFPPCIERPIRVGYVSADLGRHSVAHFISPVLENHDRRRFEITAYSNRRDSDEVTLQLMSLVDHWRFVADLSDVKLADLISEDGIDILVDLSGHTRGHRLEVFASKPAPVQITWIGYPNTTGLAAMDYRITDAVCDQPGETEHLHTEELLRLPKVFSVYAPPKQTPEVASPPAMKNGYVTFGSFNNYRKYNDEVLGLWADLLAALPTAHLVLKTKLLENAQIRQSVLDLFAVRAVTADRVTLLGGEPDRMRHYARYAEIDIALDPFPYCGTTTSCEAMWMGVPLITLAGEDHRSRVGVSQLNALGLSEWVASDKDDYLEKAIELASDLPRLEALRAGMRERMMQSPLMDGPGFTRDLEAVYEHVWQSWCKVRAVN